MLGIPLTTDEPVEVVVTVDPAVLAAWTAEERGRYALTGEPPAGGLPADAARFVLRPLGWRERRVVLDAGSRMVLPARGGDIFVEEAKRHAADAARAARRARAAAGTPAPTDAADEAADDGVTVEGWLSGLTPADLDARARYGAIQLDHAEAVARAAVVEVRDGGAVHPWAAAREALARMGPGAICTALRELRDHAERISRLPADAAF